MLQSSTIGFTNLLPNKYTKYNVSGQEIAGILTCFIQIIIIKLFNSNTITISIYYFIIVGIGDIYVLLDLFLLLILGRYLVVRYKNVIWKL